MLALFVLPLLLAVEGTAAAKRTIENTCPAVLVSSDRYYLQLKGDYCYRFVVNTRKDYSDANRDCQKHGGILALPKNIHINDFLARKTLYTYGTKDPVWIGLHDKKKEKKFVWEDHKKLGDWNSFARDNGFKNKGPDREYEDCVALHPTDTMWHDYHCHKGLVAFFRRKDTRKRYICQYTTTLPEDNPIIPDIYNKPPTPPNEADQDTPQNSDSGVTTDDSDVNADESDVTINDSDVSSDDSDVTADDSDVTADDSDVTVDDSDVTADESDVTVDDSDVSSDDSDVTSDDSDVTTDDSDVTADDSDVTADDSDVTVDDSDVTSDDSDVTIDKYDVTADDSDATPDTVSDGDTLIVDQDECPAFSCDLDCGFFGYKTGKDGCPLCKCGNM